jgi:hypothetical protein
MVTATATTNITHKKTQNIASSGASDFVFAVRLAKINKGLLQTDWSIETFANKATFKAGGEKIDVAAVVKTEGLDVLQVIEDEDLDCAIIVAQENVGQKDDVQTE